MRTMPYNSLGKWLLGGTWGWLALGLGTAWAQMPQYGQYIYRPNPPEVRIPPNPEEILPNTLQPVGERPRRPPCQPRLTPPPQREAAPQDRRRTLP